MAGYDEQVAKRQLAAERAARAERAKAERRAREGRSVGGFKLGNRTERPHHRDGWGSDR